MDALSTRIQSTQHLRDICNGTRLVFGCILLSTSSLSRQMGTAHLSKKIDKLFLLGMQLEPLMKQSNHSDIIQIMSNVLQESHSPNRFTQLIKTRLNGDENDAKDLLSSFPVNSFFSIHF